jgi:hypothetical protein
MPGDKITVTVNVPREIVDALKKDGLKVATTINALLRKRYEETQAVTKVQKVENVVIPIKPMSYKEHVISAITDLQITRKDVVMQDGFTYDQVENIYLHMKKRGVLTTHEAVYKTLQELKWK